MCGYDDQLINFNINLLRAHEKQPNTTNYSFFESAYSLARCRMESRHEKEVTCAFSWGFQPGWQRVSLTGSSVIAS